jgi:NAD(P)-dependent dehydrogenase (short-subunit alcohol dehydrogenase family)
MTRPERRVAFITGGTRGIGLACARRLAADGHQVVVGSRTKPSALDDGLLWVECDVTDSTSVDQAFSAFEGEVGPATILVANAGITKDLLLLRMDESDFTEVIDANLTGTFRVVKRGLRPMMKARWGRVVLMSSVVGSIGQVGQANYAASKAGLVGFGRSVAREYASRGITVNVVAPGPVASDMFAEVSDAMQEAVIGAVPVGRIGKQDEVAAAVAYLTSEEAAYVTGAVLPVDGGLGMAG